MQRHCGSSETTSVQHQQPLCPKPRRLCPSLPDFLKPLSCSLHTSSQQSQDGRSGALCIIDKRPVEGTGTREAVCGGCSPVWYTGSPPGRTGNPLVHDVHFIHHLDLLPTFSRTKA